MAYSEFTDKVKILIKAGDGLSLFCFSLGLMSRFFQVGDEKIK